MCGYTDGRQFQYYDPSLFFEMAGNSETVRYPVMIFADFLLNRQTIFVIAHRPRFLLAR